MKGIILPLVLAGGAMAGEAITLNTKPAPTDWVEAVKQAQIGRASCRERVFV